MDLVSRLHDLRAESRKLDSEVEALLRTHIVTAEDHLARSKEVEKLLRRNGEVFGLVRAFEVVLADMEGSNADR